MAKKLQIKRGIEANLPTLSPGEFGLCLDTEELYIGGEAGNLPVTRKYHAASHKAGGADPLTADDVGAMSAKLLWKNASPTASFPEQTITLPEHKSGCVAVLTRYGNATSNGASFQIFWLRPKTSSSTSHLGLIAHNVSETTHTATRQADMSGDRTSIAFKGGYADGSPNDQRAIPMAIYEVEGLDYVY